MTAIAALCFAGMLAVLFAAASLDGHQRKTITRLENRLDDAGIAVAAALHRGAAEAAGRHAYSQAAAWRAAADEARRVLDGGAS